ncbi:hematopoietic prostaglandin D synthase-like [Artemia franciscana]|uniref:glutathione transferase n=1 Tax=Artemia franciscana TaxID=6661 RepID=A0AA88HSK4_ARTSF|nr:hypothetical protein QYM36_011548 [Artemia franciscana]
MPKTYKLTYFNLRAKGEPIRLILAYGNIQYEDNRIEFSDWPALKPKTPFGQLPVLEVDGKPLAQSNAIARFLAKQCNLMPATDWEQAQADELADLANDIFTMTRPVNLVLVRDDAKRQSAIPEVLASLAPLLDKVEARLLANSHGWLVGNKISWVDLLFFATTEFCIKLLGKDAFSKYPKQQALFKKIKEMPQIAAYLIKRKDTMM